MSILKRTATFCQSVGGPPGTVKRADPECSAALSRHHPQQLKPLTESGKPRSAIVIRRARRGACPSWGAGSISGGRV